MQNLETDNEKMAFEVSNCWDNEGQDAASLLMHKLAKERHLPNSDIVAVADIAAKMIHGQEWK